MRRPVRLLFDASEIVEVIDQALLRNEISEAARNISPEQMVWLAFRAAVNSLDMVALSDFQETMTEIGMTRYESEKLADIISWRLAGRFAKLVDLHRPLETDRIEIDVKGSDVIVTIKPLRSSDDFTVFKQQIIDYLHEGKTLPEFIKKFVGIENNETGSDDTAFRKMG